MEGCVGRVGQPTTRTGSSTFCRFGSTGAASPPPPAPDDDTPESAKSAVKALSSFASRGRTRGDVGASGDPGAAAAFGEDGGDDFGDAARVTLDRAAASASLVKRGCA